MIIILVRHAETDSNASNILQGQTDIDLNARGIEQAHKLATRLLPRKVDQIYSSDLRRASRTAEILRGKRDIQVNITKRLRERSFGIFEGKHKLEFHQALDASGLQAEDFRPARGESFLDIEMRAASFLADITSKHLNESVLVVGHGAINLSLLKILTHKSYAEILQIKQGNTCMHELEVSNSKAATARLLNFTAHLNSN